jgi:FAD/FMN-containing dehydrogenase
MGIDAALAEIVDVVSPVHVLADAESKAGYEVDWTRRFAGSTPAVARPGSVGEVAAVVEICRRHGVAIVPQGGNTGMVGGGVPLDGELVLSTRRLTGRLEIDRLSRQVIAGAGVTVEAVQQAAAAAGLRYPVDFGARGSATIGGSIATNAGGINLVRYGGTREQLVGVEAVLGTGSVVRRMGGLIKDNTGYHLPSLLCGSEGTLGVITEARLRLVAATPEHAVAMVAMESVEAAVAAVARWRSLASLEAVELLFDECMELVLGAFQLARPLATRAPVYVLIELSGDADPGEDLAIAVGGVDGVLDAVVASDSARRQALWRLREEQAAAIQTVGVPHKYDVTIPQSALAAFTARAREVVSWVDPGARVWMFGHVGDGNLHVNVTGVAPDSVAVDLAVYELVVAFEGSISAEHGIGTAKARYLPLDRDPAELTAMRAIKSALDPDRILNPNVLFV